MKLHTNNEINLIFVEGEKNQWIEWA